MNEQKTPQTDANITWKFDDSGKFDGFVNADFSRQLERELAAEQEKARKLAADLAAEERGQDNLRRMVESEQEKCKRLREDLEDMVRSFRTTIRCQDHEYTLDHARATLEATR